MPIKRLTPIVPGVRQPVLFIDDKIRTGFVGGEATQGHGFPQWAMDIFSAGGVVHYFRAFDAYGVSESLCGRVDKHWKHLHLSGNYPRCKDCERKFTKALRAGRQP